MNKLLRLGLLFLTGVFLMYLFFPKAMNYNFDFSNHVNAANTLQINFGNTEFGNTSYRIRPGSKEWDKLQEWFKDNTGKWKKRDPSELKNCEVEIMGGDLRIQFDYKGRRANVILNKEGEVIAYSRSIKPGELDFLLRDNP